MRVLGLALAFVAPALLAACVGEETSYRRPPTPSSIEDPAARTRLEIDLTGNAVLRAGVLILPLKIQNLGPRTVRVVFDRCEVEDTTGARRTRHRGNRGELMCFVPPHDRRDATLVFGETAEPLAGDTFRVYLWIEQVDGSGLVDGVPPLLVSGRGKFDFEPRPFRKDLSSPSEAYPPSLAQPPVLAPDAVDCPRCSAPRTGKGPCPRCGLP